VTRLLRFAARRNVALAALAVCIPATPALAQSGEPVALDGNPLNIFTDQTGSLQFNLDGQALNEFYDPDQTTANSGFGLLIDESVINGSPTYYSRFGGFSLPNPSGPVLGPGTLTTDWSFLDSTGGAEALHVTQIISYRDGDRQANVLWRVTNTTPGSPINFRATAGGDLAIRGGDTGIGFFQAGPPRFFGEVSPDVGAAGGFVEDTPWSHFQEGNFGTVSSNLGGAGVNDTVLPTSHDAGLGVQWSNFEAPNAALQPGQTAEFRLGVRFVDTLGLDPPSQTEQTGDEAVVRAKLGDVNGVPAANQPLRWEVSGSNPANGSVTTNATGGARIGWIGGQPGLDVLTVYQDTNGNEIRDDNETQATAQVTWEGPSAPIPGETVNIREESGSVRFQPPKGTSSAKAKRLGFPAAAANKYQPLSAARSIPVGSRLDTRKGTVRLLSAGRPAKNNSIYQGASFRGGEFVVKQRNNSPITEMSMKGGSFGGCKNNALPKGGSRKIATAARRRRSLFGRGRGRFRTRGRNSSATVRGTTWQMTDTCKGTVTVVRQGRVVVRDFTKKKNVLLKAKGKRSRYLARPPKRRGR
jgi:hypothetical protein